MSEITAWKGKPETGFKNGLIRFSAKKKKKKRGRVRAGESLWCTVKGQVQAHQRAGASSTWECVKLICQHQKREVNYYFYKCSLDIKIPRWDICQSQPQGENFCARTLVCFMYLSNTPYIYYFNLGFFFFLSFPSFSKLSTSRSRRSSPQTLTDDFVISSGRTWPPWLQLLLMYLVVSLKSKGCCVRKLYKLYRQLNLAKK